MMLQKYTTRLANFYADCIPDGDCWIYSKAVDRDYGRVSFGSKTYRANKFSYMIHKGHIPDDHVVRHTCDKKLCVNPNHLITGTHQDNMFDMVDRNRVAWGSRAPKSKLTETAVRDILRRYLNDESETNLAKEFDVSQASISAIVTGKTWTRITGLKFFPETAYL